MNQYPPPEEYQRQRRRLDAIRPWAQAVAAGLAVALIAALGWNVFAS